MMKTQTIFFVSYYKFHWPRVNSLHAKFYQRKHDHVFTCYVIPPHWHAKDNWNPSLYKTRTFWPRIRPGPLLHSQYHCCWCPGYARSQGISNHDIDLVMPRYVSPLHQGLIQIHIWYFTVLYQWLLHCMSPGLWGAGKVHLIDCIYDVVTVICDTLVSLFEISNRFSYFLKWFH